MFALLNSAKVTFNFLFDSVKPTTKYDEAAKDERNIEHKIAIITGSNAGMGKQAALELSRRGALVIMACRNTDKGEEAKKDILQVYPNAKLDVQALDLGNFGSVRDFVKRIKDKYPRIDILVNNAGIFEGGSPNLTIDGNDEHMQINHLSPFLLTLLLLDHMKQPQDSADSSRIIFVSSSSNMCAELDLEDINLIKKPPSGLMKSFIPYANSKLATALISRELGKRLQGTGINTYALCPGPVSTGIVKRWDNIGDNMMTLILIFFGKNVEKGCRTLLHCVLSKSLEQESAYFYRSASKFDPNLSHYDDDFSAKLWSETSKLCGISGIL